MVWGQTARFIYVSMPIQRLSCAFITTLLWETGRAEIKSVFSQCLCCFPSPISAQYLPLQLFDPEVEGCFAFQLAVEWQRGLIERALNRPQKTWVLILDLLCDLGQITSPVCASVSPSTLYLCCQFRLFKFLGMILFFVFVQCLVQQATNLSWVLQGLL